MRELTREISDPMELFMNLTHETFYMNNTRALHVKNNLFQLSEIANTASYKFITAGNRPALDITDASASSVKITYSLVPTYLNWDALNLGTDPFAWCVALWVYCGPSDFSVNITTSNYASQGVYLCTLNFIDKDAWDQHTQPGKRQMRIYVGRGSTTTLSLVVSRHRYLNNAWEVINRIKTSNITVGTGKGWHLFFLKPLYGTRSSLIAGFDDKQFTEVTSFFNNTENWTQDYWLGSDVCFSSAAKASNLPRGPVRLFNRCEPAATFADLYNNDVW